MTAPRWAARLTRAASGLVVLGTVGAVVGAAGIVAAPAPEPVPATLIEVEPARTTLVCPGPLQQPEATSVGGFDTTPVAPVLRVRGLSVPGAADDAAPAEMTLLGEGAATVELTGRSARTAVLADAAAPVLLQGDAQDGSPAWLAGATSARVSAGDLRGLAAAGCQAPASDLWLVGGSTEIGSSAFLVIENPGATTTDVAVELWGPAGQIDLAGSARYLVAPGAQRVVVLSGVAAEQRRLVAHLTTTGGAVSAYLQDSRLRGFTAAGTDLVVPGAPPAARQVVAGVLVEESSVDDVNQPVLRLLAPGADGSTARLTLLGEDGPVSLPGADEIPLTGGVVTDVPLGGLPAGAYTVVVDADVPLVAAAMLTRAGAPSELDPTPTLERAWAAAAAPAAGGLVATAAGADSTILIARAPQEGDPAQAGPGEVVLRAYGQRGEVLGEQAVPVAAGHTARVALSGLGAGVTGVEVVAPDDDPVWAFAVVAEVVQPDGVLAAVLGPAPAAPGAMRVSVRQGSALGLG
ncbi:DUF5719 family protein [Cellulomonas cellasea]|uniref:DUF5719 family protein n=1 Tax=Cellulomonas cellasea TaxID=43670 RepID=UPI0025A39095|nr:DUF5719 family protein [Cellulomonas cellasea]MDM8084708.1 DUF5719 family protein [Cellulomonas cellasea]